MTVMRQVFGGLLLVIGTAVTLLLVVGVTVFGVPGTLGDLAMAIGLIVGAALCFGVGGLLITRADASR